MKTSSTIVVLLVFLILAGMIVSPVCAYTQYWTHDFSGTGQDRNIQNIVFRNAANGADITHMTWTGKCYTNVYSRTADFKYANYVYADHDHGWGTWTQTSSLLSNWSSDCTITIDSHFNAKGDTGEQTYELTKYSDLGYGFFWDTTITAHSDGDALDTHTSDVHAAAASIYAFLLGPASGTWTTYYGTSVTAPVSSFTCTPTVQNPDSDIVCTDTSINIPTSWLWSIDMEGAGIDGWQTHTGQNFTWQTHYPGLYSVNLWANNSAGSDWENKTNYVYIGTNVSPNNCNLPVASGYVRSMAQCVDSQTSGSIHGCAISMKDQEANAWSNNSATVSGTWCIDTYPLHHISAYGSATGYSSVSRTDLLASDSIMYELLMVPGYVPPAAAGKVWLYVLVNDLATGAVIPGAQVSISGSGQATQTGTTDSTGSVHKQWANVSTAYVSVSATGYSVGTKTIVTSNFGPDVVRVELSKGTLTVAPTQTTGPGGTIPVTPGPYGTPGPMGTMAAGYTNNQGQMMLDYLAAHGMDLIQLCFLVTVCALLGIKFGK
jgi:PKD repeat protein